MQLQVIQGKIHEIRGQRVMLDYDLAELYSTETKRLKEAVRRNIDRFPADFMFELTRDEYNFLRTQIASLEKGQGKYSKYLPFAFSEQGVAMLASILNSPIAIQVNISIVRAFVLLRQYALDYKELKEQIQKLEKEMNRKFKDVFEALNFLINPPAEKRKPVGYKVKMK